MPCPNCSWLKTQGPHLRFTFEFLDALKTAGSGCVSCEFLINGIRAYVPSGEIDTFSVLDDGTSFVLWVQGSRYPGEQPVHSAPLEFYTDDSRSKEVPLARHHNVYEDISGYS